MAIFSSGEASGMADSPAKTASRDSALSIIATDLVVIGELRTEGVVKVEGTVEGDVHAGRQVLIATAGEVKGDIHTAEVIVGGKVQGSIYASERVEVQATSVVHGDIVTKRILVHEGGEVNGSVRMGDVQPSLKAAAPDSDGRERQALSSRT